jgi:hypothetical protein
MAQSILLALAIDMIKLKCPDVIKTTVHTDRAAISSKDFLLQSLLINLMFSFTGTIVVTVLVVSLSSFWVFVWH